MTHTKAYYRDVFLWSNILNTQNTQNLPEKTNDGMIHVIGDVKI